MIELVEGIVRAAEAHLKARLPLHITQVNAEWAAQGLAEPILETPTDDSYYPGGWAVLRYPCVELASPEFDLLNLQLHRRDMDGATSLAIRGSVHDARTATGRLYYRACRFAQALIRPMLEHDPAAGLRPFGPNAELARERPVRGVFRFNPETLERDEIVAGVILVFDLELVESV